MSVLDRKLVRELLRSRGVLAAVIAVITTGISCFVGMYSLYLNLEQARQSYYAQCRMADFWITLKKVPNAALERLQSVDGIGEFRSRITFQVRLDLDSEPQPLSALVVSTPPTPEPVINSYLLKRGSRLSATRPEGILVDDAFARERGIKPGDRLHVILNNRRANVEVLGTAISSEFVYTLPPGGLIPDPAQYAVLYVTTEFAEETFDFEGAANQIVGRWAPGFDRDPQPVLDEAENVLRDFGVTSATALKDQSSHWFLVNEIQGLRINVLVMPGIFLAVAAVILNVLMTRLAEQQRTILGTLKALGYTNRQITVHFLKHGMLVGLTGGILGAVGGYAMAAGITLVYREYFEFPRLVNVPHPPLMLAGVLLSTAFGMLGSARGARKIAKLHPAEAMRTKPPPSGHRIWLERIPGVWNRITLAWRGVLRNLFRQRTRTVAGIFAALMGTALLVITFSMRDGMLELVHLQFEKLLRSDFDLTFRNPISADSVAEVRGFPGVTLVEPQFIVACELANGHRMRDVGVIGLQPGAVLTVPRTADGSQVPLPRNGLLLSKKLAALLDVSPGDWLRMTPTEGQREPRRVYVARVIDTYLGMTAYARGDVLSRTVGEENAVSVLQVRLSRDAEQERRFYQAVNRAPTIQGISAIRRQKQQLVSTLVDQMMVSTMVVVAFAGLIFFCSILNSALIALSERQVEVATLRVLGYTSAEVSSRFLRESLTVNIAGLIAGIPLGVWLSRLITQAYDTELFRIPFALSMESVLTTIALAIGFTFLAHWPVHRAIARMNWLEALNARE